METATGKITLTRVELITANPAQKVEAKRITLVVKSDPQFESCCYVWLKRGFVPADVSDWRGQLEGRIQVAVDSEHIDADGAAAFREALAVKSPEALLLKGNRFLNLAAIASPSGRGWRGFSA